MVGQSTRKVDGGRIPGPQPVPNCVEVKFYLTLPNGKAATIALHGENGGSFVPGVAMANNLLASMGGAWNTRLSTFMNIGFAIEALSVRDMTDVSLPEYRSTSARMPIGGAGTALPADVSAVLTEKAVVRGRGASGRVYIPGWQTSADSGSGVIAGSVVTALTSLGTDWFQFMGGVSLTPCIAKPRRQEYMGVTGALHPERAASTPHVSAYLCLNNEWDTQRRRGH